MLPALQLSLDELLNILETAKVLRIMAEEGCKSVTVDYVPPRPAMALAREDPDIGLEMYPSQPIVLTFTLDDAMFGGSVYAAITCGSRVIIRPFPWVDYASLATLRITRT